jgi:NAD(P)-dependent dehydrogenase (short-subunit alcohol dehydrogenase family)
MPVNDKPVWFITGCSTGFGRELARHTLELGYPTVVTARTPSQVEDLVAEHGDQAIALTLDVTKPDQIDAAVKAALARFGRIDVLVNNAGYGLEGAVEETSLEEVRQQYDVNVFGMISMIQGVLPHMRARRSGHVVNISSMGGITTFPALTIYNSTKFAVEGLSQGLAAEVKPFGIKVTIIEPGSFRTNWAGASLRHSETVIADYEPSVGAGRASLAARNGQQVGDPKKAAVAIVTAVQAENPPLHLLLGSDALMHVGRKLGSLQAEIAQWAPLSLSTNFSG